MHNPIRVMFVCDGGSARSRMAEGLLKHLGGNRFDVYSAGLESEALNPLAVDVMQELGIAIDSSDICSLNDFESLQFDYVIALCDEAKDSCLSFPGDSHNLHWTCLDPGQAQGIDQQQREAFIVTRDQLRSLIENWLPIVISE